MLAEEKAMPGMPLSTPAMTPPTVPLVKTKAPAFDPGLMPETIREGGQGRMVVSATRTQSAGVPSTLHASQGVFGLLFGAIGWGRVTLAPFPDCSDDGATTTTSATSDKLRCSSHNPGDSIPSSFNKSIFIVIYYSSG